MSRKLVIGDIHGEVFLLQNVLKKCNFNYENDFLIILGDVVNRGKHSFECVEELLKITHKIFILGNHDDLLKQYLNNEMNETELEWWNTSEVTKATARQYTGKIPQTHIDFFNSSTPYYIYNDKLFVHAGFDDRKPISLQQIGSLNTTRDMILKARYEPIKGFSKIFVGHTPTYKLGSVDNLPLFLHNVVALDTGSNKTGKITIMDVDSLEYWQSNPVQKNKEGEGSEAPSISS